MAEQFAATAEVVSFDSEELILVDGDDKVVGHQSKAVCHDGEGILHRAFSLFVFDPQGRLLLQQRGHDKRLWPGYWANSCCSHPRRGEATADAGRRRLREELGMHSELEFVYKFQYQAHYQDLGSEHELCHVFVGQSADPVRPNPTEIAACRFVSVAELDREMADHPERFTPWLQMEWQRLRAEFGDRLPQASASA